jgi:surface protein
MALTNKLSAIGDAIREKTGTTDLLKLDEMPTAIANIESGGGKYAPRWLTFRGYKGTELNDEIANLDTSNMTSMYAMFYQCMDLKEVNLKHFNTSKVTNMEYMFYFCDKLTSLDLSSFDTSNVTSMDTMFRLCSLITELDLSNFDTSNVTDMVQMFYQCSGLTKLDIRNFTFDKVKSYGSMFGKIPTDCLIIVKDDNAKTWVLDKRNDFTNIKTLAEYQAEGGV